MDMKRLRADVKRQKAKRPTSAIGRVKTGATKVIRQNYSELVRLHEEDGLRWTEIAAALAVQGVSQGVGDAITGRRLQALMRNIARQNEKESRKTFSRFLRQDVVARDNTTNKLKLAPELTTQKITNRDSVVSEDEIRRSQMERHAHLLKRK